MKLLILFLPLFFAAPIQILASVSPSSALLLAVALCALGGFLLRERFEIAAAPKWWGSYSAAAVALAVVATAVRLWSPLWGALVSTGGGDVGDHVFYISRLERDAAAQYNSLIVFHSFAWWWKRLTGGDYYSTFAVLFWSATTLLVAALVSRSFAEVVPYLRPREVKSGLLGIAAVLAVALLPFEMILLPVLHILQGEGYYPQLWGLLPLVAAWLLYSVLEKPIGRAIALGLALIVYRYTYTLNLGEFVFTSAVLLACEFSRYLPRHRLQRWAIFGCLVLGVLASYRIFSTLLVLLRNGGATKPTEVWYVIAATASMGAALAFDVGRAPTASVRSRSASFVALFALISAAVQATYLCFGLPEFYYFYKFGIHPLWIAAAAVTVHLPATLLRIWQISRGRNRAQLPSAAVGALLAIAGVGLATTGVATFRPSYQERSSSALPPVNLVVFYEPEAASIIEQVLRDTSLRFGGYITRPAWALSGFMNASLGMPHRFREPYYRSGKVRTKPGHCVFWDSTPGILERLDLVSRSGSGVAGQAGRKVRALSKADVVSREFRSLPTGEMRTLSYRCFR